MLKDWISYVKGCQECQKHGPIQRVPVKELQSIIKPWPFRGWAMDLIEKIYPPSSGQHYFIIVRDNSNEIGYSSNGYKIYRGTDHTSIWFTRINHCRPRVSLCGNETQAFADSRGIKILNSTPYYAQANGQAEATNKMVINIVEKMVDRKSVV